MDPSPIFNVEHVSFSYRPDSSSALKGVTCMVMPGDQIILMGANGAGKTTFLKLLAGELTPTRGRIFALGSELAAMGRRTPAWRLFHQTVGLTQQDTDEQLRLATVWDEIAFRLFQTGAAGEDIERRVAETAEQMQIEHLLRRPPAELSGGEQKRVALASLLVTEPSVLLLDEPTSGLDPLSTVLFIELIQGLCRDGLTLIISTNDFSLLRLLDTRVLILGETHELMAESTSQALRNDQKLLVEANIVHPDLHWHNDGTLHGNQAASTQRPETTKERMSTTPLFVAENVWHRYHPEAPNSLRDVNLGVFPGERTMLVGANGSGKSTLLKMLAGVLSPVDGRVSAMDADLAAMAYRSPEWMWFRRNVGLMEQNSRRQLHLSTVWDEVAFRLFEVGITGPEMERRVEEVLTQMEIHHLADARPTELSMGEQKRVALAAVLAPRPSILLLDEPTAGLDPRGTIQFIQVLQSLEKEGLTLLMATHDLGLVRVLGQRLLIFSEKHELIGDGLPNEILRDPLLLQWANLIHHRLHLDDPGAMHEHEHTAADSIDRVHDITGKLWCIGWRSPLNGMEIDEATGLPQKYAHTYRQPSTVASEQVQLRAAATLSAITPPEPRPPTADHAHDERPQTWYRRFFSRR